jgi:HD-like signal output (HDOD) protein
VSTITATLLPPRGKALNALNQLPPFSPTLSKLLATLANEDVYFGELSGIIEKDAVLASHVLKLVNSALYARSGTINSVRHAVSILGINKLRNVALSLSVSRIWKQTKTPKTWSQGAFNLHAVAVAVMCDLLAQRLSVAYPEGAFTSGLLHGMGKMMIVIGVPLEYDAILRLYQETPHLSMEDAELHLLGCTHAELCTHALSEWKLPVEIQRAVGSQHLPPEPPLTLGGLLHASHQVVNLLGVSMPCCSCRCQGAPEAALSALGLGAHAERILSEYKAEFDTLKAFF